MQPITENTVVNMEDVLGNLAIDYNIPYLTFNQLVTLGMRTAHACNLDWKAKKIPFAELCDHIQSFVQTPFGQKVLRDILAGRIKS